MKYWKLALPISVIMFSATLQAETSNDPKVLSDQLFRAGLDFCNAASKKSRVDTDAARDNFDEYLSHLERAKTISPNFVAENSFASREAKRCELVQDNIARAEAMPLLEESLTRCSEAKNAFSSQHNLEQAEAKLQEYQGLRDQALETTPTVLRVGSVAVQVRVCDRLEEKISLAKAQNSHAEQKSDRVIASYNKAAETCDVSAQMLKGGQASADKLQAADQLLVQVKQYQTKADQQAGGLLNSRSLSSESRKRLAGIQGVLKTCHSQVVAKIESSRQKLVEQAQLAAAKKIAKEEASLVAAAPLPKVVPPQTIPQADLSETAESMLQGGEMAQLGANDL